MSKLLFNKQPIVVDRTLARVIGLNESIVVQQLHYWIKINEEKDQNFYEGRYWTYNSIKLWHENEFSFWSHDTVKRIFKSLEKMGILISGNFNREKFDKTKWYSLDYEKLQELSQSGGAESTNGEAEIAPPVQGKMPQPIPENTTENSPENTNIQNHCEDTIKQVPYEEIENLFNSTCLSLPKIQGIKGERRKAVSKRWRENPDINVFMEIFKKVQSSDFLSGRNGAWMGCCFDWIMKPTNFQKIIEGNYDKRGQGPKENNSFDDFDFTNL